MTTIGFLHTADVLIEILADAAWPLFEAGDHDGYARAVATAARARAAAADVIVLAQPSLAPVAPLLADLGIPVLSSPRTAVARAVAEANATS